MSAQSSGRCAANLPPARPALLVVECEEDRSAWLSCVLAGRGYDVEVVRDLRGALAVVAARMPVVALVGNLVDDDPVDAGERLRASGVSSILLLAPAPGALPRQVPRDTDIVAAPLDPDRLAAQIALRMTLANPGPGGADWVARAFAQADAGTDPGTAASPPPDPGLFDALDDGVALVDRTGRIVWSNAALGRLFGLAPLALRGLALSALLPTPGRPLSIAAVDPEAAWTTTDGRRADGTPLPVDVRLRLVGGPVRHALVTVRDAGPRRLVEQTLRANSDLSEQLRRSQKIGALGRLAGGVAHDFNNLLQVIGGYAETLGVDRLDLESRRRLLDSIHSATDRASSLTRQLLAFGRRQVLVPEVLDLNDAVRSLEHMLTRVIGEDVALVSTLSPDLRAVRVDAGQIEQVVLNLAINARDAMLAGGSLEIVTDNVMVDEHFAPPGLPVPVPCGPWVHLAVHDTGSGMDAATVAQAFEPFFTTKDTSRGSGLGLSMVYGIVKQSGGFTWIDSTPGTGTTVHVLLPAVAAPVEHRPADAAPVMGMPHMVSGTVLLVEDDPEVRGLFATFLRHAGHDVLEAADGREALEIFEQHAGEVDVVVTDVVMPHVSGPALAGALRARRPDVKLLYVSGYNEHVATGTASDAGAIHLPKPVTRSALLCQVAALLARSAGPSAHTA